jgi:perosamine synthetase
VDRRVELAARLTKALDGIDGVASPIAHPDGEPVFWRYVLRVDPGLVPGGPVALAGKLRDYDIASAPRYIQKPAFRCQVFAEQRTFGNSRWPFTLATAEAVDYSSERFPGTFAALDTMLVLPWNERYEDHHIDRLAAAIGDAVNDLQGG